MKYSIYISTHTEEEPGMGRFISIAKTRGSGVVSIRYAATPGVAERKALAAALEDNAKYIRAQLEEDLDVLRA